MLAALFSGLLLALTTPTAIQHVIVIVQDGRTFNYLFNGFAGAYTVTTDPFTGRSLSQRSIGDGFDACHTYACFVSEYDNGAMDGFTQSVLSYAPSSETTYYTGLATTYGIATNAQASDMGPAGPTHQDLIAGQSGSPNAIVDVGSTGNYSCGNTTTQLQSVPIPGGYPGPVTANLLPCFTYNTILDEIESAGGTWNYYCSTDTQVWCAPYAISAIWNTPARKAHVIQPETTFLTDIAGGTLANLTYISPSFANSDAAGHTASATSGATWVQSVVNAVKASKYWNSTVIFLTWTDWGGWYDPTCGSPRDSLHPGCRVPLLVISPYAKPGYIDTKARTTCSMLRFVEDAFTLASLGQCDALEPDDMMGFFDFSRGHMWGL